MEKEKRYTITCTESQLRMISSAIEDWHRFLSGQCELSNATAMCKEMHKVQDILNEQVRPYIVPELYYMGSSYGWDGRCCPNDYQRKMIAMSYGIYRQIEHFFALQHPENDWNVYLSPTLTCKEQGPLIKIEEAK